MKSFSILAVLLLVLFVTCVSSTTVEKDANGDPKPWGPYPPCVNGPCIDPVCCGRGHNKYKWPQLVGKSPQEAKATIEKENPLVTVVILRYGDVRSQDFCCNRVFVVLGPNGNVFGPPIIG